MLGDLTLPSNIFDTDAYAVRAFSALILSETTTVTQFTISKV